MTAMTTEESDEELRKLIMSDHKSNPKCLTLNSLAASERAIGEVIGFIYQLKRDTKTTEADKLTSLGAGVNRLNIVKVLIQLITESSRQSKETVKAEILKIHVSLLADDLSLWMKHIDTKDDDFYFFQLMKTASELKKIIKVA